MATDHIARDYPPAPHDGGCACRFVHYRMASKPLFVHCCHCRWCQRETGGSFALNGCPRWPDIHTYTASKQPWVVIPADTPAVPEYYRASERWPKESLERRAALLVRSKR